MAFFLTIIHLAPIDTPLYLLSPHAADLGVDDLVLTLTLHLINMVLLLRGLHRGLLYEHAYHSPLSDTSSPILSLHGLCSDLLLLEPAYHIPLSCIYSAWCRPSPHLLLQSTSTLAGTAFSTF